MEYRVAMPATVTQLTPQTLGELDARISVPTYDRARLVPRIVHIGLGGFHRSHQAAYLDDLCERGRSDWAIVGAGVMPGDSHIYEALQPQDYLYCLLTADGRSAHLRVIGSIVDYVLAVPSTEPLVAAVADPRTRIVSLTVTEGGYPVSDAGNYVVPAGDSAPPAFEAIARGLRRRRDNGLPGVAVMSCDNIVHNGAVARVAVLGAADGLEPGLADWIEQNVTFPSSMVDRITPATTAEDRGQLAHEYGVADRWPVVAETFTQWVIEDDFPQGRPPWEDAGVLLTDDVEPYEQLKLRVLNAGHSCLAYLAALAGHTYVHEVVADEPFREYLRRFFEEEAAPALPPIPGVDVPQYERQVVDRFSNPRIRDTVSRLCLDGTAKFPKFLVPTIEAQLDSGGSVRWSALALAGWCQYLLGRDDQGKPLTVAADPNASAATHFAEQSLQDPRAFLGLAGVFGSRLPREPDFVSAFTEALGSIREQGVHATLGRMTTRDG